MKTTQISPGYCYQSCPKNQIFHEKLTITSKQNLLVEK